MPWNCPRAAAAAIDETLLRSGVRVSRSANARLTQEPHLTIIDGASRTCLALIVARQTKHEGVLTMLVDQFRAWSTDAYKANNGSDFIATAAQIWLGQVSMKTMYIAPGSLWEIGHTRARAARCATSCSTAISSAASPRQEC